MKFGIISMLSALLYFTKSSEGFGVPFLNNACGAYKYMFSFIDAMSALEDMEPIETVYLDFDKTITVNDYSSVVRDAYCKLEYPNCTDFDATDKMVYFFVLKIEVYK